MAFTNSSLVSYTKISPHKSSRNGKKIDTISIHCAVGQCSVETLGNVFQNKEASANYGIGYDGRIGLYVDESERSWCTSSKANDERAITIECASDTTSPYAVKDKVYNALIELLVDVCKRNGIKKLVWSTKKSDRVNHRNGCNMTVHRDYENKSCPGKYLYDRHGAIAEAVNKKLGTSVTTEKSEVETVNIEMTVLKKGSSGAQVKTLQRILRMMGYKDADGNTLEVDGSFGTKTLAAVKKFQKNKGSTSCDGVVGAWTWGKLLKG